MSTLLASPVVRMVCRAVLAGLLAFAALLQSSATWDSSLLRSALVAGVLAFCEWFTPLNQTVGVK